MRVRVNDFAGVVQVCGSVANTWLRISLFVNIVSNNSKVQVARFSKIQCCNGEQGEKIQQQQKNKNYNIESS